MILNGIDFLKDFNWKGRGQVSLTDLYLMERFGSVVFILNSDVQSDISAGEICVQKMPSVSPQKYQKQYQKHS